MFVRSLGLVAAFGAIGSCSGASTRTNRTPNARLGVLPRAKPGPLEPPLDPIVELPHEVGFFGEPDAALRASLANSPVAGIHKGGGGRSLGFKITLEDGTLGYFKPEQTIHYTHWWAELGAYYLDRELGIGRVPPSVGRRFDWGRLQLYAQTDPRRAEMRPRANGSIRGAFIAWVHEGPVPLPLGNDWEKWVRLEGPIARTPYVPPTFQVRGIVPDARFDAPDVAEDARRPAELSDLLVFDYLIQNADRWGTQNANVRTRGRGGPLMFFDNGAGFWPTDQRMPIMERRLTEVQRFRRRTVDALRRFDVARFRQRVGTDPLAPILSDVMIAGLEERIGVVVDHVDRMQSRYGEAIWLGAEV